MSCSLTFINIFLVVCIIFLGLQTGIERYSGNTVVTYLYWKDCGHCKHFMPEWDKFAAHPPAGIKSIKKEKDESDAAAVMSAARATGKFRGFPFIMKSRDGVVTVYEGDRTAEAVAAWASAA